MPSVVLHEPLSEKGLNVSCKFSEVLPGRLTLAYHSEVIDLSLLLGSTVFALCAPDSEPGGCNIRT
jgi:hypothetical protein